MNNVIPLIFDRQLYLARQQKASGANAAMLGHIAEELADRLSVIIHQFEKVLVIAQNGEAFATVLKGSGKCAQIEIKRPVVGEDLKLLPLQYNAVFSLMDVHCVNDVPGYLAQCARSLKPDGLFMMAGFAGETLHELREAWLASESEIAGGASLRIAPMISTREMGGLLQRAGLALPVSDVDHVTLRYADPLALLREIKTFGFSNPLLERRKGFTSQRMMAFAIQYYQTHFADGDGRVRATLDVLWALAWKPHDSQQKPLKPGSAKAKLADVLRKLDKGA
jgi:SAM-dependent methyltransferase